MVDVNEMRKKFPVKDGGKRHRKNAAIKRIAREYEMKKAELNGLKAPAARRGVVYYAVIGLGLLLVASLVMSATGKGTKAPKSKAKIQATKSLQALAIASGRFRYHTGEYPDTLEDLASLKVPKAGWNGPYIRKVVKDPWGRDYVYVKRGANPPTLYCKGADGKGGTDDDLVAPAALFGEPFRDTSWTKEWVPYLLRGVIVVGDEAEKKSVTSQVSNYLAATSMKAKEEAEERKRFLGREITPAELASAVEAIRKARRNETVAILSGWTYPDEKEGTEVSVVAETSGDEVELFVNGETRGRAVREDDGKCIWMTEYEPGELKAIAFKGGHPIGEDAVKTAFAPERITVLPSSEALGDMETGYATVDVLDSYGVSVPGSFDVEFALEGPGEIVLSRKGAVAFRRTGASADPLVLKASAGGLRPGSISIPWRIAE